MTQSKSISYKLRVKLVAPRKLYRCDLGKIYLWMIAKYKPTLEYLIWISVTSCQLSLTFSARHHSNDYPQGKGDYVSHFAFWILNLKIYIMAENVQNMICPGEWEQYPDVDLNQASEFWTIFSRGSLVHSKLDYACLAIMYPTNKPTKKVIRKSTSIFVYKKYNTYRLQ